MTDLIVCGAELKMSHKESSMHCGIHKSHNSVKYAPEGREVEPAWWVCIMWTYLNDSPGGFTAGIGRDINQG